LFNDDIPTAWNKFSWGLKTDDRRITKILELEMCIISEIRKMVTMLSILGLLNDVESARLA
jgi:hypothetical protein